MKNQNNQNVTGGIINWCSLLKEQFVKIYQHSSPWGWKESDRAERLDWLTDQHLKSAYSSSHFSAVVNSTDIFTHLCANTPERLCGRNNMHPPITVENRSACKTDLSDGITYSGPTHDLSQKAETWLQPSLKLKYPYTEWNGSKPMI